MPKQNKSKRVDLSEKAVSHQGERLLESEGGKLFQEHVQRYFFALGYLKPESRVLDCACGTGYGSKILAGKAREVTGMDISPTAVAYCKKNYAAPNLAFKQGSAEKLKLKSDSIDTFVSFETLEHIPRPQKLVQEAWRILKPGGIFLVSTPNRIVTGLKSGQRPGNPFHLMEWSMLEFDRILRTRFSNISYFGQRIRSKNILHPLYCASKLRKFMGKAEILSLKVDEKLLRQLESEKSWQPSLFIAVCKK
jgi:2-polyprenyl-3-methyl-5-hydroxy-6-metoxy-1,4-benzoquinol methylase